MLVFGKGRLLLGANKRNGFYAYDGVNFLKPLNLYLLCKIFRHNNKIIIFIAGSWVQCNNKIVFFRRDKKDVARYIPIKESLMRAQVKKRGEQNA